MFLEFPEDRNTHYLDRQYMFGPSLLVAPVFGPQEEETEYYIPKGVWTYYWDQSRTVEGPMWIKERVPLDEIPIWIRPATVLVRGPSGRGRPDYDYAKDVHVDVFGLGDGQQVVVRIPSHEKGEYVATLTTERNGSKVSIKVTGGTVNIAATELNDGSLQLE